MELLDLYDKNGKKLNQRVERGNPLNNDAYIMLSIVFIKNSKSEYLIQKTSKEKGSDYGTTGGHVTSGETSISCIIRELEEELGICTKKEELKFITAYPFDDKRCIFNVFTLDKDIDINNIILQEEEVEQVMWLTKNEIINLIKEHKFKKTHSKLFKEYIMESPMKVLFATNNKSKVNRFKEKLLKHNIELLSLEDLNIKLDINENGKTAIENALIKAKAYYKETHMPVIGMDDTLYLEGVPEDKQPGVFVRRVNGKELTDEEMIKHYTDLVKKYGINGKLNCKWVYGMAVINENGEESIYSWEKDNFYMVDIPSRKINEGYPLNSISKYKNIDKYFTEITEEDKKKLKVNEDHVIEFITNAIKKDNINGKVLFRKAKY